ncbi:MAG: GldG family protein [Panacagrimonas sp.]
MKQRNQNLIQQVLGGLLFLAAIVMIGWLSVRFNVKQDWTAGKRNTISEASRNQLAAMADPVKFIAFVYPGSDERSNTQFFVDQYRRFKKDVELEFIDPSSQPQKVKEYNISFAGEVVLEYQGRRESLRQLSEQNITTALQRLTFSGEKWIGFLEGHGERSTSEANDQGAYTRLAQVLRDKGLKVLPINLIKTPTVPDNISVLVIASPRSPLFEGEVKLISDYVRDGGNLLWLTDPDYLPGLDPLAQELGVGWKNGFAVFPEYELLGTGHPGIYAALGYPPGPVTRGMDQVTLFPIVRSIDVEPDRGWQSLPMLQSNDESWLETSPMDGRAVTKDGDDLPGPLTIGVTQTRDVPVKPAAKTPEGEAPKAESETAGKTEQMKQQRVALVGDADFLSDAYLTQYGNQQLGLNIIQWLAQRDSQLNIDVPKAPDTTLFLPDWAMILIGVGFVIVLPLLLIGTGVGRWIVRRRR